MIGKKTRKDGQAFIGIVILFVVMLVLAIIFIAVNNIQGDINDFVQEDDSLSNQSKHLVQDTTDTLPAILDTVGLIFFVGFWIASIVTAYLSFDHPVLAFISIGALALVGFSIMVIGNSYEEFTADEVMGEAAEDLTFINYIMTHYLVVFIAVGVSVALAFALRAGGGL